MTNEVNGNGSLSPRGQYRFAVDADITSGVDRHTFRVFNPATVLFEKIG
jgi:hypothetical protein